MRNLRKRRKLIRQMEQANKIPDKLMPQEIKDMLDVAGFRPVIENTPNSAEIKINSRQKQRPEMSGCGGGFRPCGRRICCA